MFIVEFPEHYTQAMRLGVVFLLFLVESLGYLIWFGGIKMDNKKRLLSRQKKMRSGNSESETKNPGENIL